MNSKKEKGQALIEFALTTFLFLGLLFGIIEFGRFWYYSSHLGNSVRAAARYAAVLPNPTTLVDDSKTYARQEIETYLPPKGLYEPDVKVISMTDGTERIGTAAHGDIIRISVRYDFSVIPGTIIPGGFNGVIPITRSASINYESMN